MGNLLLVLVLLLACITANGQGQFFINNRYLPDINEPVQIFDPSTGQCIRPSGNAWTLELLGGPEGAPVESLQPLLPTLPFRTGAAAGYVAPTIFKVPGVRGQQIASVVVRVFSGANWETSPLRAQSAPVSVWLDEGGTPDPIALPLPPGSLNFCIPEPSSLLLVPIGFFFVIAGAAFRRTTLHEQRYTLIHVPNQPIQVNGGIASAVLGCSAARRR